MNSPTCIRARTISRVRRGQGEMNRQNYQGSSRHQFCYFAGPPNVLNPIGFGKAQIAGNPSVAHVIAIQQHCVMTGGIQLLLHFDWRWSICRTREP